MRSILNLIIAAILYLSLIAAHPQPLNAQLLDHNALITELQQHRSHTTALIEQTKAVKERIANMEEAQACSSAEDSIGERLQLPMKETVLEWHARKGEVVRIDRGAEVERICEGVGGGCEALGGSREGMEGCGGCGRFEDCGAEPTGCGRRR